MFQTVAEFLSERNGDSAEFIAKARAIVIGLAREYRPQRLYLVRIGNWFGPRWVHFAGKLTVAKGAAVGVHKTPLHVPPFVPHRVIAEGVFTGPEYEDTVLVPPLHIECTSKLALRRQISEIDKCAVFVWFSSESDAQKRGSVMVYLPVATDAAFYVGYSLRERGWEPAMLRSVSLGEIAHLEGLGRDSIHAASMQSV